MRIFWFELKKVWKNRLCLPLLFVLCVITVLVLMEEDPKGAAGRRMAISYLTRDYTFYASLSDSEKEGFRQAMVEKYGENVFDSYGVPDEASLSPPGYFGEDQADFNYIQVVTTLTRSQKRIDEIRRSVVEAAKAFGRDAVREGNDYEIRRNLDVIRLYQKARTPLTNEVRNWNRFLFTPYPVLLTLFAVFFLCSGIFSKERDSNAVILLATSANGKGETVAAKYAAAAVSAVGCFILIRGVSLLTVALNFGLSGWDQPVWGIEELAYCTHNLTVGQYVFLAMGCELAAVLIIAALCTTVSALSKSSVISFFINALVLAGCVALFFLEPRAELLKGPLALATPLRYFESYYTANVLTYPIPWMPLHVILWGLLCTAGAYCSGRYFSRVRERI